MSDDSVRSAIAAEVRAELARQQKTQRWVADVLGLPQPSVQVRLVGKRPFRAEELVALADALEVPVSRFLPAAGDNTGPAGGAGTGPTGPSGTRPGGPPPPTTDQTASAGAAA